MTSSLAEREDPFGSVLGTTRGQPTPVSGPPLDQVSPDLDFSALARAAVKRWKKPMRRALVAAGIRDAHAERLCADRHRYVGDSGHRVHIRAHDLADRVLCASRDEYGTLYGSAQDMTPAPRGVWRETEKVSGAFELCRSCERELKREKLSKRDRRAVAEEMSERAAFAPLPKAEMKQVRALAERELRDGPAGGLVQELADAAARRAFVSVAATVAGSDHDRAMKRVIGFGYEQLWNRLPAGTGPIGRLLPMQVGEFLSVDDIADVLDRSLPTVPGAVDEDAVSAQARQLMTAKVRRRLALRDLALTADA